MPDRVRLGVEQLECRCVPSSLRAEGPNDLAPFAAGAPWSDRANRAFVEAQPTDQLQRMYFNSPSTFRMYSTLFKGVLRQWVASADRAGLTSNAELMQYLGARLDAHFVEARGYLARLYPGQTDQTYRLLMAMNLAHGYYTYATVYGGNRTVYRTLHLRAGDCTEIAELLVVLAQAQGIAARSLGQSYSYPTDRGAFVSSHVAVYAGGLWLDAEINVAFALDFRNLLQIAPEARLQTLLNTRRVFGFYNEYLRPDVRTAQLSRGLDGGIIAFYYQYYFAGIGNGNTQLHLQPSRNLSS